LRIGIIGCGNIGSEIAKAVDRGEIGAELVGLFDIAPDRCVALASLLEKQRPKICANLDELLDSKPDVVVEAASQEAVRMYAPRIVRSGISIVVLSVGALMDPELLRELLEESRISGAKIYIPSGAVGGLDIVKAASLRGCEVVLTTRKPAKALKGSPGAANVDLDNLVEPVTLFEGDAVTAVKLFPANVNVAATLSLACGKPIRVRVVADPSIDRNIHEVEIRGAFGEAKIVLKNVPSPTNPRTSYLAVLSAIELLREIASNIRIGT